MSDMTRSIKWRKPPHYKDGKSTIAFVITFVNYLLLFYLILSYFDPFDNIYLRNIFDYLRIY